jgi:hypothetical protein
MCCLPGEQQVPHRAFSPVRNDKMKFAQTDPLSEIEYWATSRSWRLSAIFAVKAFDREGRKGGAKVAKKTRGQSKIARPLGALEVRESAPILYSDRVYGG